MEHVSEEAQVDSLHVGKGEACGGPLPVPEHVQSNATTFAMGGCGGPTKEAMALGGHRFWQNTDAFNPV